MMDITYTDKPVHGAVIRAKNIMNEYVALNVDLRSIDDTSDFNTVFYNQIVENGELRSKYVEFSLKIEDFRTIMLATNLKLSQIIQLDEILPFAEFETILSKSTEALGGDANHFFGGLGIVLN
jgi:hypothetical protein